MSIRDEEKAGPHVCTDSLGLTSAPIHRTSQDTVPL